MSNYNIIDKMSLVHIISFIIIGLIKPNDYKLALTLSLSWEILEYIIINTKKGRELLRKYWPIPEKYWNEKLIENKIVDVICDMIGYTIGSNIFTYIHKDINFIN